MLQNGMDMVLADSGQNISVLLRPIGMQLRSVCMWMDQKPLKLPCASC